MLSLYLFILNKFIESLFILENESYWLEKEKRAEIEFKHF